MPRAAVLSIHARVEGTGPSTWEDPSLVQLWGPRYHAYVVAARDLAVFSLGRLPEDGKTRRTADDLAVRLHASLGGRRIRYDDAGQAIGVPGNALRYAALTGTVVIRWEGARQPTVWTVPPPRSTRATPASSSRVGTCTSSAPPRPRRSPSGRGSPCERPHAAFDALPLTPVRTPIGDAWILTRDEATFRGPP